MFNDILGKGKMSMSENSKGMNIITSYTVPIKCQMEVESGKAMSTHKVDDSLMKSTRDVCMEALRFCVDVYLREWNEIHGTIYKARMRKCDVLVHSTVTNKAKYPEFDKMFPYMPSYTRRAIVKKALGIVSSYKTNHGKWEKTDVSKRGKEPTLGMPTVFELTFYDQERKLDFDESIISLKLFDGCTWEWYHFRIQNSDARFIRNMASGRKLLSPVIDKTRRGYSIRFGFKEKKALVQNEDQLEHFVLAVDLGINAPGSWCVMTSDGSVHARGVIHLACDEERLRHLINRKRMFQKSGKKHHYVFRQINNANKKLSVDTSREIMRIAVLYNVDVIVFEHLDKKGRKHGRYRERIHMWRSSDVQRRVELQAHRNGMRISRVCAWGTSSLAFDGTDKVKRGRDSEKTNDNYSLCEFQTGKVYNCDLNAAYNIGARYFLRAYSRLPDCPELPNASKRTYNMLRDLMMVS